MSYSPPMAPPRASSRLCRGRCALSPAARPFPPPGNAPLASSRPHAPVTPPCSTPGESCRPRSRWDTPPPGSISSLPSPTG
ncbi:hypothetical protein VPH35_110847 [Triticum aestivum]